MSDLLAALAASALPRPNCVWGAVDNDARCSKPAYAADYPNCSIYQRPSRSPIPCAGLLHSTACDFTGNASGSAPPVPASWHVHVFFPNPNCTDCEEAFTIERPGFTFAGAMRLRREMAAALNELTLNITGAPPVDPIDMERAGTDLDYNQCGDTYGIVAGAPANYHPEPCIFEVDATKRGGPFTNPTSRLGYPNYSFLLPGATWMPHLLHSITLWLAPRAGLYDVLLHPNSGCEVRDHVEERSITWLQGRPHALLPQIFSCRALGCNQACHGAEPPLRPPAQCPGTQPGTQSAAAAGGVRGGAVPVARAHVPQ